MRDVKIKSFNKEQTATFNKNFEFLKTCDEDDGCWTGLFDFGGDSGSISILYDGISKEFIVHPDSYSGPDGSVRTKAQLKKVIIAAINCEDYTDLLS